jgi:heptosyltransferase-2
MNGKNFLSNLVYSIAEKFLSIPENPAKDLGNPQQILIVRQHNQLGDQLAGVSLFRAIKEKYPSSHLTFIASPLNYPGVAKNRFLDHTFIFDKRKIFNPFYSKNFLKLLRQKYDLAIVPVTVSISFTSNLIARLSNSKIRIGPKCLNGKENKSAFLFDRRVEIDWQKHPDSNVADRILDIVRPFGIDTTEFASEISFDDRDEKTAKEFLLEMTNPGNKKVIGLHVGAAKSQNKWSLLKYIELIDRLKKKYDASFYLTGSNKDTEEINFVVNNSKVPMKLCINKEIPVLAAIISKSSLFITNDTGIMHVAGVTATPQISIFGSTNPFNWAPIGKNKHFIRKSELIDDVTVDDVFSVCEIILKEIND